MLLLSTTAVACKKKHAIKLNFSRRVDFFFFFNSVIITPDSSNKKKKSSGNTRVWKLVVFILLTTLCCSCTSAISPLAAAALYYIYFHFCLHLECVTFNSLNDKKAEKGKRGGVVGPQMAQ